MLTMGNRAVLCALFSTLFLSCSSHSPRLDLIAGTVDWDEVVSAGLDHHHKEVWEKLRFHSFLDFLFTDIIANYTTISASEKRVTFPSGEWMILELLSSDEVRECITFQIKDMSPAAIISGHSLSPVLIFVMVGPWTGKVKERSVIQTGFKLINSSGVQGDGTAAKQIFSAMIRTSHDTARTKLGAFPCQDDFRSYGGTCNNQENADWGSYNKALKRIGSGKFDPAFLPGTNDFPADGMPNPRIVSRILFRQSSSRLSVRQVTSMAVFWGQFIDHDIGLTPDSGKTVFEERMDIDIVEKEDPFHFRHGGKLEFARSRGVLDGKACCGIGIAERFPRDPINLQSSFIDASHVYGCHRERLKPLRTFKDGQLRVGLTHENGEHLLPKNTVSEIGRKVENAQSSSDNHFVAGDIRANEQPVLTSLHTLFMREHNRLARMLVESFPCWQDEKVFQYSRKIVASQIQQLTYRFFIPALLGRRHGLRQYRGYHNNVDPSIANFFSTCAFRFGHSMVPETLTLLETGRRAHSKSGTTLQSVFFDPSFITEIGIEALLLGASHQVAESVDCQIVDSLQNELFKNATGGVDLVSINIQRGRDHGIPKYNDAREMYGLRRKRSFEEVTSNHTLAQILSSLYTSVNEMDSFVGGLAEDHIEDSELGELFHTAVRDQFTRLRDGDRFFYKNTDWPLDMANFKPVEELNRESLTIQDIIARNSGGALRKEDFDENVFQKA